MQIFPIKTAKNIVAIMTGADVEEEIKQASMQRDAELELNKQIQPKPAKEEMQSTYNQQPQMQQNNSGAQMYEQPQIQYTQLQMYGGQTMQQTYQQPVEVHQAAFEPLVPQNSVPPIKNMDLIMDVPLDISVVLGRTKKSIQDILNLGVGSLVELDKLAEEPVEILVNGKPIALGEVVVVDENFGVRITSIVSDTEKLKSLK